MSGKYPGLLVFASADFLIVLEYETGDAQLGLWVYEGIGIVKVGPLKIV